MSTMNRWFEEVWNQGRASTIDELLDPNAIAHGFLDSDGNEVKGIEAFKTLHGTFRAALTNLRIKVEETVSEGDLTVARFVVTATHTGQGLGKPPKGRPVNFAGMVMIREKDGKIVEAWNNVDFMTMYQQME
jgi:predicted ester cyclase